MLLGRVPHGQSVDGVRERVAHVNGNSMRNAVARVRDDRERSKSRSVGGLRLLSLSGLRYLSITGLRLVRVSGLRL